MLATLGFVTPGITEIDQRVEIGIRDSEDMAAAPTITLSSGNATLASTTSGAVMLYTTDGSDPRYSKDAKTYTAAFPAAAGTRIRAVATKDGMFSSDLTEKTA